MHSDSFFFFFFKKYYYACVCTCSCVGKYMCVPMQVEDKGQSQMSASETSSTSSKTGHLFGLELTNWAGLVGRESQAAPDSASQCWDHKCVLLHEALSRGF